MGAAARGRSPSVGTNLRFLQLDGCRLCPTAKHVPGAGGDTALGRQPARIRRIVGAGNRRADPPVHGVPRCDERARTPISFRQCGNQAGARAKENPHSDFTERRSIPRTRWVSIRRRAEAGWQDNRFVERLRILVGGPVPSSAVQRRRVEQLVLLTLRQMVCADAPITEFGVGYDYDYGVSRDASLTDSIDEMEWVEFLEILNEQLPGRNF